MSEYSQFFIAFLFFILIECLLKPSKLRKWLSLTFLLGGLLGSVTLSEKSYWGGFDLHLVSLFAIVGGLELFFRRNRHEEDA
ncbi:hypothetical protein [Pseudomonas donghuensis]|uniref:Uncharacterized protein n=1 Tax=Pseudomonas donghuensis TaxID=1163398 RepID=A0AAP0SD87_9PSED|nr:hypothetical protein [Pseudomonas donghuensis]KDN98414.2 hypothetical protein BV82_3788 [Pseudomonas donghuensis]MCP6692265.1 hypothetical protein [Pseudomonas donghuensis]MDF9894367.1 hypothetical protein [Pseudomonas vranovensis]